MPSFAIPKFTVLLEPLWVPAEFLLLSTGPNLDGTFYSLRFVICEELANGRNGGARQ